MKPFVSVIVPCRNEERFIARCLDSLVGNTYPKDRLELLVVDGMSEDGTRGLVAEYSNKHPFIRLLENGKKHATAAFNIGIRSAKGEVIIIVGAHCRYEPEYISKSVEFLYEYGADNVGGVWRIAPRQDTLTGRAIAAALATPLGAGNAYTKIGSQRPRWVDTVFGGCYKKEVFDRVGLFDEELARSQDIEFNMRLKKAGGKILFVPEIACEYFVRSSLNDFAKHNFDDGFSAFYPLKYGRRTFTWRHLAPLLLVGALTASAGLAALSSAFLGVFGGVLALYALAVLASSALISLRKRDIRYLLAAPPAFVARHIPFGAGSAYALLRVLCSPQSWRHRFGRGHKNGAEPERRGVA